MLKKMLIDCGVVIILWFASNPAYAEPKMICGKVINIDDGHPIKGVTIKVEHSRFVASSDQSGEFCLDYVPGEFRVLFRKKGFFPHAVNLKIAQKFYFPLETTRLKPAPKLVNMYGNPIEGARLLLKKGHETARGLSEVTDSGGMYTFDYVGGDFQVRFSKVGFQSDGFPCNLDAKRYPDQEALVLCPDKFGVYVEGTHIPPAKIVHLKPPSESYRSGHIPRVKGHWEGEYYIEDTPKTIESSAATIAFHIFPLTNARLGPGGDPLESGYSVVLLKVSENGKVAQFGPNSGDFERIDCKFEPIMERMAHYSGGLVSQRFSIYKVELTLESGKYAFCQFEKPPLHKFFIPSETAFYFQVKKPEGVTPASKSVAKHRETSTDQKDINALLNKARLQIEEGKRSEALNTFKRILEIAPDHEEASEAYLRLRFKGVQSEPTSKNQINQRNSEKEEKKDSLLKALSRLESRLREADRKGSGGNYPSKGVIIRIYPMEVEQKIKSNWSYPVALLDPKARKSLEAIVVVKVDRNGAILETRFKKRSSSEAFDQTVMGALKKSDPLPPFPEGYNRSHVEVEINFNLRELGEF